MFNNGSVRDETTINLFYMVLEIPSQHQQHDNIGPKMSAMMGHNWQFDTRASIVLLSLLIGLAQYQPIANWCKMLAQNRHPSMTQCRCILGQCWSHDLPSIHNN